MISYRVVVLSVIIVSFENIFTNYFVSQSMTHILSMNFTFNLCVY